MLGWGLMRIKVSMAVAIVLTCCSPLPDTVGEAAPASTVWTLTEVNGGEANFGATLRLLNSGRVLGSGPCNAFEAVQAAPLPWVEFTNFTSGSRDCAQAREEEAFLLALQSMDFAEVAGSSLLLSNDAGQSLFFRAAEGPSS